MDERKPLYAVYTRGLHWLILLLACTCCSGAEFAKVDVSEPVGEAFVRMYNFDFPGAQAILDRQISRDPQTPLPYAVKAATHLFSELYRLKILQIDFFEDDDKVINRKKLVPDQNVRAEIFRLIERARERANARLATHPGDRDALFTLCMSSGLTTDYAALVERKRLGSFSLAKQTQSYALKLMALNPPFYDAHLTSGSVEYVVGSLYFFVRWFVRIEGIEGNRRKAIEHLQLVAERGKYYGPFARVLLAVIHLREKRPWDAETLLAGLCLEFPENRLFQQELARARVLARRTSGVHVHAFSGGG
jgi:hypothetical protein